MAVLSLSYRTCPGVRETAPQLGGLTTRWHIVCVIAVLCSCVFAAPTSATAELRCRTVQPLEFTVQLVNAFPPLLIFSTLSLCRPAGGLKFYRVDLFLNELS